MILHWSRETLSRCSKETGGKMPLGLGISWFYTLRDREAQSPEKGVSEDVEGMSTKPSLPTNLITMVVKEEVVCVDGRHGTHNSPLIPVGEGLQLTTTSFIDGLRDTQKKSDIHVAMNQELVGCSERQLRKLLEISPWKGIRVHLVSSGEV
jgi:hypothetical protein